VIPTSDLRISGTHPLVSPAILEYDFPVPETVARMIFEARSDCDRILTGCDPRLLVVVGPCSVHDPDAALDYAAALKAQADRFADDLRIVMRVYFEKPRTTVGWKGMINDPHLDDSYDINHGLRLARRLLLDISKLGLPAGTEFLDTISPQFIADLISWGAIGARTTESQLHRELASGLSMPVGFKNGTGGSVQVAVDAVISASRPHHFLGVTKQGVSAILSTTGNTTCHIILRGGAGGTNYDADSIAAAAGLLAAHQLPPHLMVDCSHGNSLKDFRNQPRVAADLCAQLAAGSRTIAAVMVESNLLEGNQPLGGNLTRGQSVTDACVGWDTTVEVLESLAAAVRERNRA
jgi:3-deoxy-7-phosphoheptulonate synthase